MSAATDGGSPGTLRRTAVIGVVVLALLAGLLWARYGGIVFVEMLASAWAMCL